MIKKILLGFILILALSVQSQTKKKAQPSYENTVKNYVKWFESLPDYKKREESIILVNKLNRMIEFGLSTDDESLNENLNISMEENEEKNIEESNIEESNMENVD